MSCQIQLQVVLHFHNPVPVRLESNLTFLLCHPSMLSPLVEFLFMSELRRSLLTHIGLLQPLLDFLLVELYLLTLQVVILKYQLALLDCSLLQGVFPWILSSKQVSEEIWSLLNLKSMVFVLLLIVRSLNSYILKASLSIPCRVLLFFFPLELPYRGKSPRFMYLFLKISQNVLLFCLSITIQSIAKKKKSSGFLMKENMDIFYLFYVYSVIPRTWQNTFILFGGGIQVPAPLGTD